METTYQRVVKVISEEIAMDEDTIKPSSKLEEDLGLDSLDQVELIIALEGEFAKELQAVGMDRISDEDAQKLITVQDICSYIEEKLKEE